MKAKMEQKIHMFGGCVCGWVGGRGGGSLRKYYHFVAPSFKLELARLSVWLRIQDGAECGNLSLAKRKRIAHNKNYTHGHIYVNVLWWISPSRLYL